MVHPPAGWYDDPSGAPGRRYWDGVRWAPPPTANSWPWWSLALVIVPGIGFALITVLWVIGAFMIWTAPMVAV